MAKTMESDVNEVSRISTGTVIKGEIYSPNDMRIDGSFEGLISSKGRVVVGEKAVIGGNIVCDNLDFWGKMTGSIYVKDTLTLKNGCVIEGDLHIKKLVVELGAHFDGNCKMLSDGEFDKLSESTGGNKSGNLKPTAANPILDSASVASVQKQNISEGVRIKN